jgi:predicted aspartyl protease
MLVLRGCVASPAPERAEVTDDGATAPVVPLELAGPGGAALLVPAHLNGTGPHNFILDTGATLTCIDAALADSLKLPEPPGQIGAGFGVRGGGVLRLASLDSIRLGRATAAGLTGCVLDLSQFRTAGVDADGLLGLNFLRSFRVTLDFESGSLLLEEP